MRAVSAKARVSWIELQSKPVQWRLAVAGQGISVLGSEDQAATWLERPSRAVEGRVPVFSCSRWML
jgi:uncharacterized protein (DUF2384 family)